MRLGEARADDGLVRLRREPEGIACIDMVDAAGSNGFSEAFVGALVAALDEVAADSDINVAILAGTDEVFSSGATREVLEQLTEGRLAPTELVLGRRLMSLPVPVVAAAEGHAVGGGFALMLSADMVVIARESRYGANFMTLGITPGMGTTRLLETVLSPAVAHELLYTGELRRGASFAGMSGFNAIVPRRDVRARAFDIAQRVAENRRDSIVLLKRALTLPRRRVFEEAQTLESLMHDVSLPNLDPESFIGGNG